jgi:hypothetical protein
MRLANIGASIYKGRKFNARKETPMEERYLGIQIYRVKHISVLPTGHSPRIMYTWLT